MLNCTTRRLIGRLILSSAIFRNTECCHFYSLYSISFPSCSTWIINFVCFLPDSDSDFTPLLWLNWCSHLKGSTSHEQRHHWLNQSTQSSALIRIPQFSLFSPRFPSWSPRAWLWAHLQILRTNLAQNHGNLKLDNLFSTMQTRSFTLFDVSDSATWCYFHHDLVFVCVWYLVGANTPVRPPSPVDSAHRTVAHSSLGERLITSKCRLSSGEIWPLDRLYL